MNEVTVHIVIVVGVAMALVVIIVAMGVTTPPSNRSLPEA